MKIVRKIEIDYGHTLPKHLGFCNQLHGHRGVIECVFEGDLITDETKSTNGMVMDFAVCKQIMIEEIHNVLDHGFAIWKNESADRIAIFDDIGISLLEIVKHRNSKVLVLDEPPTAEVLGKYFFGKISGRLTKRNVSSNEKIKLIELIWHETPNNKAIVKYEDILYDNHEED